MVELVDTYALGAYAFKRAGSSPVPGTILELILAQRIKKIWALSFVR